MDKSRAARTTKKQLEMMVDFITHNKIIINNSKDNPNDIKMMDQKWDELVNLLNGSGLGPIKNKLQWKRVLTEFKTNTRRKYQDMKKETEKTGGGELKKKPLTDIENRLIALLLKVALDGLDIPEVGLSVAVEPIETVGDDTIFVTIEPDEECANSVPSTSTQSTPQVKSRMGRNMKRTRKATALENIIVEYKEISQQQNELQRSLIQALQNISNLRILKKRRLICQPVRLPS